jgi:acyl-CoA thioesterase FadM
MKYHETRVKVRFTEVDLYHVVWHGHYLNWFEVSRNELARRFELDPVKLGALPIQGTRSTQR